MGIEVDNEDTKDGVLLTAVTAGEPAEKAGLKKGDRIVEAAAKPVKNLQALVTILQTVKPGDTITLGVERQGKKEMINVVFPYVATIGIRPDYSEGKDGVGVTGVTEGGSAAKAGIKEGDRILEIGGKPVKDIESYMSMMTGHKRGDTLEVVIVRDSKKQTVKIVLE